MSEHAHFTWDAGTMLHKRVIRAIREAAEESASVSVEIIETKTSLLSRRGTAMFSGPGALDLAYRCQAWFESQGMKL